MTQQQPNSQGQSTWTSISLFWDGIYNVDHLGKPIIPPIRPIDDRPASYDCTRRLLTLHSRDWQPRERILDTAGCEKIAVRIGHDAEILSSGLAVDFTPYEQTLVIPIQIRCIEQVNTLMFRVYRRVPEKVGDDQATTVEHRPGKSDRSLVYQEILEQFEIGLLPTLDALVLEETHSDFSNRIANYWGVEDFANWYHHTYEIEVWASIGPGAFAECDGVRHPEPRVGETVHNVAEYLKNDRILARDDLNYNYNFERSERYFKWLSDFSRIQRLLRNKRAFFDYLRHIEDYLEARPNAELLEALEFFENQARFPTTQAIPISLLSSSSFNEVVTRAYAIYDVGVRCLHGGLTHRLQWHGIMRLMTDGHTVAIAKGFYNSALELYCAARHSVFDTTNRPDAKFTIDLWSFLFDRFDKYATSDCPESTQLVQYPARYEDELHYAEQFHMAMLDLPQDARVTQNYIRDLGSECGKLTPTSVLISQLLNSDSPIPSKLHNWIERYLDQLTLPLGADYAGVTADARLAWGCLIRSDEWVEIDAALESRRIHFHNLTRTASKIRSLFVEAVVAVRVVSELCSIPDLIPLANPHRQAILRPLPTDLSFANPTEEIASYARVLSLLRQVNSAGEPLLVKMTDSEGNSMEWLKRTEAVPLSQQTIDILKLKSRISLKPPQTGDWSTTGIAFP